MILRLNNKFNITTDDYNFTLNEVRVKGEESENAGEEYNKPLGYYGTLESALKGFVKNALRKSESTTDLKGIAYILRDIEVTIQKSASISWERYSEDKAVTNGGAEGVNGNVPEKLNTKVLKESKELKETKGKKTKAEIAKENLDKVHTAQNRKTK